MSGPQGPRDAAGHAGATRPWVILAAVYAAGFATAANQAKVPPIMGLLVGDLGIDAVMGGWLMSAFALAGVALAFPAVGILASLGARRTGVLALLLTLAGSLAGLVAPSPLVLLLTRIVEGAGFGIIAVIGPALISDVFPHERRPLAMGVWTSAVPAGGFLMFNVAGAIAASSGWQGVWIAGSVMTALALVLYVLLVRVPAPARPAGAARPPIHLLPPRSAILDRRVLLIGLAAFGFNAAIFAVSTWSPSYYTEGLGIAAADANLYSSLGLVAVIPAALIGGWIGNRVANRALLMAGAFGIAAVIIAWSFRLPSAALAIPFPIALSLAAGCGAPSMYTLASEAVPPERGGAGVGIGMVIVFQSLGMFIGPPIAGAFLDGGRWAAGVVPAAALMGLAALAGLALARRPATVPQGAPA